MFKPTLRPAALAAILPALLFVAGCKDYSEQIAAVQQTAVRSIANHGETRNTLSSKPLGEYVQRDMMNDADVSWSAEGTTLDDGTEAVVVIAELRPGGPIRLTDRIDFRFRLDPASSKVTFMVMEADGEPMLNSNGRPYTMAGGVRALRDRWMVTAKELTKKAVQANGGDPNMVDMKMQFEDMEQKARQGN